MINFYNQDCLEAMRQMPNKAFDLAIVDPPYGIGESGYKNSSRSKLAISKNYKSFAGNDIEPPTEEYFEELKRVSKNQIIWGANHFTDIMGNINCECCKKEFKPKRVDSRCCSPICYQRLRKAQIKSGEFVGGKFTYLEGEDWLPIAGYEGLYEVSDLGRVRSVERKVVSKKGHHSIYSSFILTQEKLKNGYLRVALCCENRVKRYSVHRLVCSTFNPNTENKPVVNHKNLNKEDNRAVNLEWCTQKENAQHASENGRTQQGEKNRGAKLTEMQVIEIRRLRKESNIGPSALGRMFGVGRNTIRECVNGKTWKHLK